MFLNISKNKLNRFNTGDFTMKTMTQMQENIKESYVVVIIALLGIFAFFTAVLVAWPALAYLASALFV